MFRKTFLILTFVLLLITGLCSILKAQSSISSSTDFDVVQSRAGDIRLRVKTDPYIKWDNRSGSIVSSTISVLTSVDSLASYAENKDLQWVIVVEGASLTDSLVYLRRQEFDLRSGRLIRTDRDTVNYSSTSSYRTGARLDSLTFKRTPMMNLNLNTWAVLSQPIAKTYATHVYLLHEKMVPGSTSGSIATYSIPQVDSLTIASRDTLKGGLMGDTLYCSAISGEYGYTSVFVESDSNMVCILGYQVKMRGSNWAAPMDSLIGFFKAVNPAYVNSGAPRAYWVSTTPADSVRFMIINNMTGRGLLKKAYIGRRD